MATKINKLKFDGIDFICKVLDDRTQNPYSHMDFYSRIQYDLLSCYYAYIEKEGNPELIKNLNFRNYVNNDLDVKPRENTLRNLYEVKDDIYITPIINELRNKHNLLFCPFCGEEDRPSTLDHFLPKKKFPEYSVCLDNLVPMCTKCQGPDAKGQKVLSPNNSRLFIHPYFEDVENFLELTIVEPYDSPSFVLDFKKNDDKFIDELIVNHVVTLNIYNRFLDFAVSKHIHLLKLAKANRKTKKSFISKIENFLEDAEIKSKNTWSAIYYRSVLSNQSLLAYLDVEDLPDYL